MDLRQRQYEGRHVLIIQVAGYIKMKALTIKKDAIFYVSLFFYRYSTILS